MATRSSAIYFITRWLAKVIFPVFYRIEVKKEADLPSEGPAIILPKHQYWTDFFILLPLFRFPMDAVGKVELFRYPGQRSYFFLLGTIPLDREQPLRTLSSFKYLFFRLRGGEKILIFPEGTYVRGEVGPCKTRLIQMILQFQSELKSPIPFIPVGIRYGERSRWRRRVEVQIGSPLFAEGKSDAHSLAQRVMEEIGRLSSLPQRGSGL